MSFKKTVIFYTLCLLAGQTLAASGEYATSGNYTYLCCSGSEATGGGNVWTQIAGPLTPSNASSCFSGDIGSATDICVCKTDDGGSNTDFYNPLLTPTSVYTSGISLTCYTTNPG